MNFFEFLTVVLAAFNWSTNATAAIAATPTIKDTIPTQTGPSYAIAAYAAYNYEITATFVAHAPYATPVASILPSSSQIIPANASWTHFLTLFCSTMFLIIVLALAIACLVPQIGKGFYKSHAMRDTTNGNSESNEAVEEAVEEMEHNRPLQPPLEIASSDLMPENNSESFIITLEVSGEIELLIPPEEVVEIESAEQGTQSLELIKEKAIYDWKITEFAGIFTTLMDFSVNSLESPIQGLNGRLDFIRANKTNMKKLASALAYVREIGTLVRQGVEVMSARSPHPVSKYSFEMWKPLEEVEAAFFHDRDFKELMDYIEYIDKVQAEDGFKGRKFHKQHRPKVQYTFKVITQMMEEKQANTDKFLHEVREIWDRYQTGRDWDMISSFLRKSFQSPSNVSISRNRSNIK